MLFRSAVSSVVTLGLFGWLALTPRAAAAQNSCSSDTECVKGWTCQVTGGSGCGSACPSGQECAPAPDCAPQQIKSCLPGPCQTDRDCADGMVCSTLTEAHCAPTACPPNDASCVPAPCTPTTTRACIPRYLLPCATAADCGGAGFDCVANVQECACPGVAAPAGSGSAGSGTPGAPPSDAGPAPADVDASSGCTCAPATGQHCTVRPVDCSSAADCIAGWTCEAIGSTSDCASQPAPPPGATPADAGALPPADPCVASATVKQCLPPYASLVGGSGAAVGGGLAADGSNPTVGTPSGAGTPVPAANPEKSGSGGATSTAGCSVAWGANSGGAAGLLLTLGLVGGLRRRRVAR